MGEVCHFCSRAKPVEMKILTESIMERFQQRNCQLELDTNTIYSNIEK